MNSLIYLAIAITFFVLIGQNIYFILISQDNLSQTFTLCRTLSQEEGSKHAKLYLSYANSLVDLK